MGEGLAGQGALVRGFKVLVDCGLLEDMARGRVRVVKGAYPVFLDTTGCFRGIPDREQVDTDIVQ